MAYHGDKKKAYQNDWLKKRRTDWLKDNGPCSKCGGDEDLRVSKGASVKTRPWSMSKAKREEALKDCQVLCGKCYSEKFTSRMREINMGKPNYGSRKHSDKKVAKILREYLEGGISQRAVAKKHGVPRAVIAGVVNKNQRANIVDKVIEDLLNGR